MKRPPRNSILAPPGGAVKGNIGLDRTGASGSKQSDASGSTRPPFSGPFGRTVSQG